MAYFDLSKLKLAQANALNMLNLNAMVTAE